MSDRETALSEALLIAGQNAIKDEERIEELEGEIVRYEAGYQWWLKKCQGLEDELARRVKEVSEIAADRETRLGKHQIRIAELEAEQKAWRMFTDQANQTCGRLEEHITELEAERDQWQESSGQNYVRATEAEMREEKLCEAMQEAAHKLERCRTWGGMDWKWHPIHAKTACDTLRKALKESDD